MKILVTGAGGFLGRYIIAGLLKRGHTVRGIGRSPQPDLLDSGVEMVQGDVADERAVDVAMEGCDAVIHTAAKAGVWGSWESYHTPNVIGTRQIVEGCRRHGLKRLVYTSTPSVVFNRQPLRHVDESQPYGSDWLCHYAHTKRLAEEYVLKADEPGGLRTVALRPHLIWGIGDPHLLARVFEAARTGRLAVVGSGDNKVDITHVYNAAQAHWQALDALDRGTAGGKAYFISQGEPVTLWPWVEMLLAEAGLPAIRRRVSFKKAYRAGAVLETIYKLFGLSGEPPMTRFVATELAKDHYFDITAARRDLGYTPTVSTAAGVKALVEYYRKNKSLDSAGLPTVDV